eukprot:gnl/TRDRNA2_/TRDRNA2_11753_c0_seq1.p1 gnl/TRDRNA2_/TRDRNA2_11753_c0~~gnl/TRDRNA2_/TRDRNA2_11753_c0_seq1.p1  ORF type:complete len:101 (+),score=3.12 gnl/TRDRNA2_/TRDRNA2_11753_c0_seq1:54-356(+)
MVHVLLVIFIVTLSLEFEVIIGMRHMHMEERHYSTAGIVHGREDMLCRDKERTVTSRCRESLIRERSKSQSHDRRGTKHMKAKRVHSQANRAKHDWADLS